MKGATRLAWTIRGKVLRVYKEERRMAKIYVGNLPPNPSETDVRNLFSQWGTVLSLELVTDRRTGKFSGYGFVEMEENEARVAANELDGINLGGQSLRVTSLTGC